MKPQITRQTETLYLLLALLGLGGHCPSKQSAIERQDPPDDKQTRTELRGNMRHNAALRDDHRSQQLVQPKRTSKQRAVKIVFNASQQVQRLLTLRRS